MYNSQWPKRKVLKKRAPKLQFVGELALNKIVLEEQDGVIRGLKALVSDQHRNGLAGMLTEEEVSERRMLERQEGSSWCALLLQFGHDGIATEAANERQKGAEALRKERIKYEKQAKEEQSEHRKALRDKDREEREDLQRMVYNERSTWLEWRANAEHTWREQLHTLEDQLRHANMVDDTAQQRMEFENKKLKQQLVDAKAHAVTLETQLSTCEATMRSHEAFRTKATQMQVEVESMRSELTIARTEKEAMYKRLVDGEMSHSAETARLQADVVRQQELIAPLQTEITRLKLSASQTAAKKDAAIELERGNSNLRADLMSKAAEVAALQTRVGQLEADLHQKTLECISFEEQTMRLTQRGVTINEELQRVKSVNTHIAAEMQHKDLEFERLRSNDVQLKQALQNKELEADTLKHIILKNEELSNALNMHAHRHTPSTEAVKLQTPITTPARADVPEEPARPITRVMQMSTPISASANPIVTPTPTSAYPAYREPPHPVGEEQTPQQKGTAKERERGVLSSIKKKFSKSVDRGAAVEKWTKKETAARKLVEEKEHSSFKKKQSKEKKARAAVVKQVKKNKGKSVAVTMPLPTSDQREPGMEPEEVSMGSNSPQGLARMSSLGSCVSVGDSVRQIDFMDDKSNEGGTGTLFSSKLEGILGKPSPAAAPAPAPAPAPLNDIGSPQSDSTLTLDSIEGSPASSPVAKAQGSRAALPPTPSPSSTASPRIVSPHKGPVRHHFDDSE